MSRKIATGLIIVTAALAIYFTVRPYLLVQKVERQKFFSEDVTRLDEKIKELSKAKPSTAHVRGFASNIDYFSLGVLHAKKQDFGRAKYYFIETIKRDPEHAGAFNNLGNIAFTEGDVGRARALYHKAVRWEPDNIDYLVNFAYACFKVNVMNEAMEVVEKVLRIDPENSRARLLRRQMTQ